jgi:hypothetical protein
MTSDSQPVDLFAGHFGVRVDMRPRVENHLVPVRLPAFTGVAGYVGTEMISGEVIRQWLQAAIREQPDTTLATLCDELALSLTEIWHAENLKTHLSIFLAGYEGDEARFWFISNGDVPDASTTEIPRVFNAVNDLDEHFVPNNAAEGETKADVLAQRGPSFRRGVLAAAAIFDLFTDAVSQTIRQGHPQIPPIDSLERFAAYAKFRFEFTKRVYDVKYGLGTDPVPPIGGVIHVVSVDPSGTIRVHGKHVTDTRVFGASASA